MNIFAPFYFLIERQKKHVVVASYLSWRRQITARDVGNWSAWPDYECSHLSLIKNLIISFIDRSNCKFAEDRSSFWLYSFIIHDYLCIKNPLGKAVKEYFNVSLALQSLLYLAWCHQRYWLVLKPQAWNSLLNVWDYPKGIGGFPSSFKIDLFGYVSLTHLLHNREVGLKLASADAVIVVPALLKLS